MYAFNTTKVLFSPQNRLHCVMGRITFMELLVAGGVGVLSGFYIFVSSFSFSAPLLLLLPHPFQNPLFQKHLSD